MLRIFIITSDIYKRYKIICHIFDTTNNRSIRALDFHSRTDEFRHSSENDTIFLSFIYFIQFLEYIVEKCI